jgi:predicted amidohydrolase
MKLIGIQIDSVWEDKAASQARAQALIEKAAPAAGSMVVLPEMFATGFSMNVEATDDSRTQQTQSFLSRAAAEYKIYLIAGVVGRDASGKGRNECVVYDPEGREHARYCKLQPFTLGGESAAYVAGDKICLFSWGEFTVAPYICYDLRFPEIFRLGALGGANLITVIASWPAVREDHWISLLKARAIENQAYVIGINRCGNDPNLYHSGRSRIIDYSGKILAEAGGEEAVIEADIDLAALDEYRNKLPFLTDARSISLDRA